MALETSQSISIELNDYMESCAKSTDFMGSVRVVQNGGSLHEKGYGFANLELRVPNTPLTKFRIGSITKQFTAMATLILQEGGKLNVEDHVTDHLSDIPEAWQPITVHHLVTNTSGIMHSWALPGFRDTIMNPASAAETIGRFKDQPLVHKPGEAYHYSGVGFFVLAQIVEKVSGQTYGEFLQDNIFRPLGMQDTGTDETAPILPNRASGYSRQKDGSLLNCVPIHMPILTGGGNLYSTVRDLSVWDEALNAGKLVSQDSYKAMYTPVKDDYAFGWRVTQESGRRAIAHGGGVSGFNTRILRYPNDNLCVLVFSNVEPTPVGDIAKDLAKIALGI